MTALAPSASLEDQIDQWRAFLRRRQTLHAVDVAELEDHLRQQIASLSDAGLAADEAFLVAVKRMGGLDALSLEFAREHSERLWKQLVAAPQDEGARAASRFEALMAFGLAGLAALAIKAPALAGVTLEDHIGFYLRNLSLFVLPLLAVYFIWKRKRSPASVGWIAAGFVLAAAIINLYPFQPNGSTETLAALHLPIALWLVIGLAYAGARWREISGRMDFIRFSGELFIYYVLIALGGGVLTAFMLMIFQAVGVDIEPFFENWILPCGACGAVLVAAFLVEAKQSVIENMAPVLARLFAPLFTIVLLAFLGTVLFTGRGIDIERNVLIAFDLLLAVVLGLILYSASARDPSAPPDIYDALQIVLVASALMADAVALFAIASRISEFGLSPNRIAALGENLILIVNLAGALILSIGFMRGTTSFAAIERWQTGYIPVYAIWSAIVVAVLPLIFRFA